MFLERKSGRRKIENEPMDYSIYYFSIFLRIMGIFRRASFAINEYKNRIRNFLCGHNDCRCDRCITAAHTVRDNNKSRVMEFALRISNKLGHTHVYLWVTTRSYYPHRHDHSFVSSCNNTSGCIFLT